VVTYLHLHNLKPGSVGLGCHCGSPNKVDTEVCARNRVSAATFPFPSPSPMNEMTNLVLLAWPGWVRLINFIIGGISILVMLVLWICKRTVAMRLDSSMLKSEAGCTLGCLKFLCIMFICRFPVLIFFFFLGLIVIAFGLGTAAGLLSLLLGNDV